MEREIEPNHTNALFGKYELGKLLGCGAFAKVYHACNLQTSQSVAIKVFNKKKITTSGLTANIKREIIIMSRLRHAHIVGFHEVLATKTKIFFVIELVRVGELFSRIAMGRFSEDLSRKYFQQLISAVGYCHSHGVFHRDLKPDNLLLDDNGSLKVSDFGLSALRDQIRPDGLLHTLCGTPAYVAPEVLSKKGYDGAKVDVWSCGVILFTLAAGYLPFNDPNLMVMYKKIHKGEFRCPKWMSVELRWFLSRLLDTNPNTRITLSEIHQDRWFKKGYKEVKIHQEYDYGFGSKNNGETEIMQLNAFDLISFSLGLNLSGLFYNATERSERFLSADSPEKIMQKVEKVARAEGLAATRKKKEGRVVVEGVRDNLGIWVEVYRLTDELVMVEARRCGVNGVVYIERLWNNRLRPLLRDSACTAGTTSYRMRG